MNRPLRIALLLALPLLTSGCSGRFFVAGSTWFERTYTPQVGRSTYDEVLKYERQDDSRPPVEVTTYSLSRDVILLTRTWGNFDRTVQKTVYHAGSFLYPATSETESVVVRDGIRHSFVFERGSKVLRWAQTLYYDEGKLRDSAECGDAAFKPGPEEEFTKDPQAREAKTPSGTLEARLRELQGLRERRVITEEEYARMREKALSDFK